MKRSLLEAAEAADRPESPLAMGRRHAGEVAEMQSAERIMKTRERRLVDQLGEAARFRSETDLRRYEIGFLQGRQDARGREASAMFKVPNFGFEFPKLQFEVPWSQLQVKP